MFKGYARFSKLAEEVEMSNVIKKVYEASEEQ